ncbi:MAG: hypothetical protein HRT71_02495, partial [Flavobacteriales bacterium]|nr:hypothetical protein [Flavobacteriales bacterium]
MGEKSFKRLVTTGIFTVFILTACNIFNPSGEGDLPETSEGKLSVGQSLLQSGDYAGAMNAFKGAIEDDSTNSFAYYSYAKAARFKHELNGLQLSKELTGLDGSSVQVPFLDTETELLNTYLGATTIIRPILEILITRDSLTRWYNDYDDESKTSKNDIARRAIMDTYWEDGKNGVAGTHPKSDFPLSDGVINFEKVTPDMALVLVVHVFASLKDLNGDGVID